MKDRYISTEEFELKNLKKEDKTMTTCGFHNKSNNLSIVKNNLKNKRNSDIDSILKSDDKNLKWSRKSFDKSSIRTARPLSDKRKVLSLEPSNVERKECGKFLKEKDESLVVMVSGNPHEVYPSNSNQVSFGFQLV